MLWHADGTIIWRGILNDTSWNSLQVDTILEFTDGTFADPDAAGTFYPKASGNNEQTVTGGANGDDLFSWRSKPSGPYDFMGFCMIFPEYRDVYGIYWWYDSVRGVPYPIGAAEQNDFQYSSNTTNGVDGDWTTVLEGPDRGWCKAYTDYAGDLYYRSLIYDAFEAPAVRALRWWAYAVYSLGDQWVTMSMIHVYGMISAGQTPDRIIVLDYDTGLEYDAVEDWGDVPRGTVLERRIQIKNLSPTLAATSFTLDFKGLTGDSHEWYEIKDWGGSYSDTLDITSVAAGATYPSGGNYLTVKLDVPNDAKLSVAAAWLDVSVPTWV